MKCHLTDKVRFAILTIAYSRRVSRRRWQEAQREEKRGRKWIGYLIIEVLLVIPILVLLFVMGQFLDREREQQRERLEQSESWEDSQIPVEMAEALSAVQKWSAP